MAMSEKGLPEGRFFLGPIELPGGVRATIDAPAAISAGPTAEVVGHEWPVVLPGSTFRPDGSARHRIRDRDGTIHEYETGPKARTWHDDPPMI
jgi:hypothetical protein